jgi:glycine/D-amino acid oxidase-like deaminating enzyme
MKYTDIAVIGGGLAGSTAAAMLGRAGIASVLIDPHETYPFDFRVEKLSSDAQLEQFFRTGTADSVLRSATHDGENWIARFGYLLDKRPSRQFGISYKHLISAIRAECRAAPQSRHRTPNHQPLSLDLDRLRPGTGRTIRVRFSGDDLLFRADQRPYPLSDAVSGRRRDARQPVHLSRDRRSLAAQDARPLGGSIFNVGLSSITASQSKQALCAAARAGGESDCAVAASVHSRAAGRLRFDSPAICPTRYRSAYRPCLGGRPTTGP